MLNFFDFSELFSFANIGLSSRLGSARRGITLDALVAFTTEKRCFFLFRYSFRLRNSHRQPVLLVLIINPRRASITFCRRN